MFIPIGDSPNPPGTPWITYGLIAINVLVFIALLPLAGQAPDPSDPDFARYLSALAQEGNLDRSQVLMVAQTVSSYDLVTYQHGFKPGQPEWGDVLASMFLHGGLLHLLGNMLFLWIYGDNVEHRLGRTAFLLLYLATGAVACGGDALLRMGSLIPSVGASGAISGVLGFYFLWFPHNRVRVWVFFFPFIMNVLEFPARVVLGIYIVLQNVLPALLTAGQGGVSHGAHLGGFIAGLTGAFLVDRLFQSRPEADLRHRAAAPPPDPSHGGRDRRSAGAEAIITLRQAMDAGRWDLAAELYFDLPQSQTRRALDGAWKVRLGEALLAHKHPRAALALFQRALADHPVGSHRPQAHLGAAGVLMTALNNPTGAYQHLYAALEENPTAQEAALARSRLTELAGSMRTLPRRMPGDRN